MSDLDRCKQYLRSILLANKGGVPGSQLVDKYKHIAGESLPYKKSGSLKTFLLSIPDVCSVHCPLPMRGGEMIVVGVETKGKGVKTKQPGA